MMYIVTTDWLLQTDWQDDAPRRSTNSCKTVTNVWGSTRRHADWLTVSHNVTLTLTSSRKSNEAKKQSKGYDRRSVGQSASLSWCQAPFLGQWPSFYYCHIAAGLLIWAALADEWTIAVGLGQRSDCQVRVRPDLRPNFTLTDSRLLQLGWPGPLIYIL
jgi:hypothetical protein